MLILWSVFLFFSCSLIASDAIVYLTWQRDPSSTMTVQWLTKKESPAHTLEYKELEATEWTKKEASHRPLPEDALYTVHTVELTALKADTKYRFRLPPFTEEYLLRTMPQTIDKPIRFIVGGDLFDKSLDCLEKTSKKVAEHNPRFVLLGGDIAYSVSDKHRRQDDFSRWLSFLSSWSKTMKDSDGALIPLIPAIGNHEVKGYFHQTPLQAPFFYALFAMPGPQGYAMLRFGSYLSVAILDSGHTHPVGGAQTAWLAQELKTQRAFLHRFAIYHVPAYPSARYFRGSINTSIRRHWCPLFEQYGIHAAFEHHDHAYKRTHPLVNGDVDKFGVVYFGDGCWGAKPRIPKKASRTTYLAKTQTTRQFLQIDLTKTSRTYTAYDPDGGVIDSYEQKVGEPNRIDD